LAHPL